MNRRKSKILSRAASILANKKSRLTWDGYGSRMYPKDSARAIYQRLKIEVRDPERYKELQALVNKRIVDRVYPVPSRGHTHVFHKVPDPLPRGNV